MVVITSYADLLVFIVNVHSRPAMHRHEWGVSLPYNPLMYHVLVTFWDSLTSSFFIRHLEIRDQLPSFKDLTLPTGTAWRLKVGIDVMRLYESRTTLKWVWKVEWFFRIIQKKNWRKKNNVPLEYVQRPLSLKFRKLKRELVKPDFKFWETPWTVNQNFKLLILMSKTEFDLKYKGTCC
jgi:hypothetical protein